MSRSRIITWIAAGVTGALAAAAALLVALPSVIPSPGTAERAEPARFAAIPAVAPPTTGSIEVASAAPAATESASARFDIVRIDPDGASVFAGRAAPRAEIAITANGQVVVAAKANDSGEWSAVTDHRFAPGQYNLGLSTGRGEPGASREGQQVNVSVAAGTRPAQIPLGKPVQPPRQVVAAANPGKRIVTDMEALVASAKNGESAPTPSIPLPIMFKFREASFTTDGQKAASLLVEYLSLRRLDRVTLSGHADERGTSQHNMELSRQRLDAVARHLRGAGFTGQLEMQPKGDTEPFRGVDRQSLAREDAYQLDRRVELHVR